MSIFIRSFFITGVLFLSFFLFHVYHVVNKTYAANQLIRVSANNRFLIKEDGSPFFWMGDTAWELFHRTSREEADLYLTNRAGKKFNVIQAVVLAEKEGITVGNFYGHLPLLNQDPTRPNEEYFKHVDYVINKAESLGLYIGLLPTWGDKVTLAWGPGPVIFTTSNAEIFGRFLGNRYKTKKNIIWILGGDRNPESAHLAIWRAMAKGIAEGEGGAHIMTYHPQGGSTSSTWFHTDTWLAFNMRQNGHCRTDNAFNYAKIQEDYKRTPTKPVIDGEPIYEDHPVCFNAATYGTSNDSDVRRAAYTDVFAGAFGHTYGHHSIWQFYQSRYSPTNDPKMPWQDAMNRPGGSHMQYLRALMESRPFVTRVPDQSFISTASSGVRMLVGTRDTQGSYAMVYFPFDTSSSAIQTSALSGSTINAWWYNTRDGKTYTSQGQLSTSPFLTFSKGQSQTFDPPGGSNQDWVLVLDDASKQFPTPGTTILTPPSGIPTPTSVSTGGTTISLQLALHGIGKGGDNVNAASTGTLQPLRSSRAVTLELFNATNQALAPKTATVQFQSVSGLYTGIIDLSGVPAGMYTARVKIAQYLRTSLPGIVKITANQTTTVPRMALVTGDVNDDNLLSIQDYTMILDCFSDLTPARNCSDVAKKQKTDITDDGNVNQFDYNLFLRELSVQSGN